MQIFKLVFLLSISLLFSCNDSTIKTRSSDRGGGAVDITDSNGSKILSYSGSYALIIGQSDYAHWGGLNSIPSELNEVESVLEDQGFVVERHKNLNSKNLKRTFEKFINNYGLDANNRLLFFYSGHGYSRLNGSKGYIVPVDAPNPNFDEKGFVRKAIAMNKIVAWAEDIESKHALFLFDSCFSGTVFKLKNMPKIPRQITQAMAKPVRQFITAGSADEEVPASSTFTPAFVDALRDGKADMYKDGYVTGEELGLYLKNIVSEYTDQTPQFGKIKNYKLSRGDFVFKVAGAKKIKPPTVVTSKVFQDRLRDGSLGPKMVRIPAGSFRMGDIQGGGYSDEKPVHRVSIGKFAMGMYEVTFAEYDKFAEATGRRKPSDRGWGRGNRPVINVSWNDATAYTNWLSDQTGYTYRLPTEAEWEYAARAGTETKYWWGNRASHEYANYGKDECCGGLVKGKDRWKYTSPVGSFLANKFGLYDTSGNVWEWTCSEYKNKYNGKEKQCVTKGYRLSLRGGSWFDVPGGMRSADRDGNEPPFRVGDGGFRVSRLLTL
jgi:formylglycine-generating enzyme required for sulfatase activity